VSYLHQRINKGLSRCIHALHPHLVFIHAWYHAHSFKVNNIHLTRSMDSLWIHVTMYNA